MTEKRLKSIDSLRQHGLLRLDVYVNEKMVATLSKEGNRYVLTYDSSAKKSDFISLSLPVRAESWVSAGKLHSFFEMNLPEGARKEAIAMAFGKAMLSEEMSLLAICGSDAIGRVKIIPSGFNLNWRESCVIDVKNKLREANLDSFFEQALKEHAGQGVSGVQPKILVSDSRITLKSNKWILKRDGIDTQWLSANEYLSIMAARKCGLDVPDCELSKDGRSLLVARFDLDGFGFEDFCSLFGVSPVQKYSGSIEKMIKTALLFSTERSDVKNNFIRSIIFNTCIGNSDAHLKNFALIYKDSVIKLSPFYDLVSIRAFDRFKNDIPSLSIGGKKEWKLGKAFFTLTKDLGFSKSDIESMISEVAFGVEESKLNIVSIVEQFPLFREHAKSMLTSWSEGQKNICGENINFQSSDLSALGFSGVKPISKIKIKNPYASDTMKGDKITIIQPQESQTEYNFPVPK